MRKGMVRQGWVAYFALWAVFPILLFLIYSSYRPVTGLPADENRISSYDPIIHKFSREFGLDWRLVASMISVESRFRHDAISPAGALGLMQIMPAVAREQNVELSIHPEKNIRTGIAHFAKKLKRIKGRTEADTLRLSLAAYNAGLSHLRDAQNLAIENGKSPRLWDDVSQMLVLLEIPDYSSKAKYGYCQGSAVVEYVSRVMEKYQTYVALYPTETVRLSLSEAAPSEPRT